MNSLILACNSSEPNNYLKKLSNENWNEIINNKETSFIIEQCIENNNKVEDILLKLITHGVPLTQLAVTLLLKKKYKDVYFTYLKHLNTANIDLVSSSPENYIHILYKQLVLWFESYYIAFNDFPTSSTFFPFQIIERYKISSEEIHAGLALLLISHMNLPPYFNLIKEIFNPSNWDDFKDMMLKFFILSCENKPLLYHRAKDIFEYVIQNGYISKKTIFSIIIQIKDQELFKLISKYIYIPLSILPNNFPHSKLLNCPPSKEEDIKSIAEYFSNLQIKDIDIKTSYVNITLKSPLVKVIQTFFSPLDKKDIYQLLLLSISSSIFKTFFCPCCSFNKTRGILKNHLFSTDERIQDIYCTRDPAFNIDLQEIEIHLPHNSILPGQLRIMPSHHVCDNGFLTKDVFMSFIQVVQKFNVVLVHEGKAQDCFGHANAYITTNLLFPFNSNTSSNLEEMYTQYEQLAYKYYNSKYTIVWQCRLDSNNLPQSEFKLINTEKRNPNCFYSIQTYINLSEEENIPENLFDDIYEEIPKIDFKISKYPQLLELTKMNTETVLANKTNLLNIVKYLDSTSVQSINLYSVTLTKLLLCTPDWNDVIKLFLESPVKGTSISLFILSSLIPQIGSDKCIYAEDPFVQWLLTNNMDQIISFIPNDQVDKYIRITSDRYGDLSSNGFVSKSSISSNVLGISNTFSQFEMIIKAQPSSGMTETEINIGKNINILRLSCPHFILTLGHITCKSQNPLGLKKINNICSTSGNLLEKSMSYIFLEYIPETISLQELIKQQTNNIDQIYNIIVQSLLAIKWANKVSNFTHYDLHCSNILAQNISKSNCNFNFIMKYMDLSSDPNDVCQVATGDYLAFIIDYGFSHINGVVPTYTYPKKSGITPDESSHINDVYTLITSFIKYMMFYKPSLINHQIIKNLIREYLYLFYDLFSHIIKYNDKDNQVEYLFKIINNIILSKENVDRRYKMFISFYNMGSERFWFLPLEKRYKLQSDININENINTFIINICKEDIITKNVLNNPHKDRIIHVMSSNKIITN